MGWDYFDLSSVLIAGLVLYLTVSGVAYLLITHKVAKKETFKFWVIGLLVIHTFMLLSLTIDEKKASSYRVGLEIYVCDRQIVLADQGLLASALSKDEALTGDGFLYARSQGSEVKLKEALDQAEVLVGRDAVEVQIDSDFELKARSEADLSWLEGYFVDGEDSDSSVDAMESSRLKLKSGELTCPDEGGAKSVWRAYIYSFDHDKKTYKWESLENLSSLESEVLRGSDGRRPADCLVLDYGSAGQFPENDCLEVIKSDVDKCADVSSKECEYVLEGSPKSVVRGGEDE